ncbi:hypothetical protein GUITHDRAFT_102409 [Guillardia theta CCMP2712]|uniref:Uncharacterized protein n=1 Tax=Guillardia theta (strain CCMP2712) TaxID=905079 RepID=L1JUE9_GUITC|nr:hypothetical protein GUITHDRAFT_102409 [Guillardia theta CCMP2712]EKX51800.1 hypothetical protein GUITHDRAFT_102409 [Guillardia theta CCMP2712]|eukprot:XP_005838780.1 hypothetical protein GUITHDRAFT_102409 [Guillardia theta CCMP2712]
MAAREHMGRPASELEQRGDMERRWRGIDGGRESAKLRLEALQRRLQRSAEELQGSDGSDDDLISHLIVGQGSKDHGRKDASRRVLDEKFRRWMDERKQREVHQMQQLQTAPIPSDQQGLRNTEPVYHARPERLNTGARSVRSKRTDRLTPYQARMLSDLFKASSRAPNTFPSTTFLKSSSTTTLRSGPYKAPMSQPHAWDEPVRATSLKEVNASIISRTLLDSDAVLRHASKDLLALEGFLRNLSLRVQRSETTASSARKGEKPSDLQVIESATAGAVKAVLAMLFSHEQISEVHDTEMASPPVNETEDGLSTIPRSLSSSAQSIGSSILKIMNVSVLGNQSKVEKATGKAVLQELTTAFRHHQVVQRNKTKLVRMPKQSVKHKPDSSTSDIPGLKYVERDYVLSHINGEPVIVPEFIPSLASRWSPMSPSQQQLSSDGIDDAGGWRAGSELSTMVSPPIADQEWQFSQDAHSGRSGHSEPKDIRETVLRRENMGTQAVSSASSYDGRKRPQQPGYYGATASIYESIDRVDRLLKASEDVAGFASLS